MLLVRSQSAISTCWACVLSDSENIWQSFCLCTECCWRCAHQIKRPQWSWWWRVL